MFIRCNSFEDFREVAFAQAEDMNLFEQMFILDGESVCKRCAVPDGEWPTLSSYRESDFNNAPTEYPVVIYGVKAVENDRFSGDKIVWIWDFKSLKELTGLNMVIK